MYVCLMVLNKSPIKESTQFVSVPVWCLFEVYRV